MMRASVRIILICLVIASTANGFDYLTTRGVGLGQTVVLSDASASAMLVVPAGSFDDGQGMVELGAVRRFELKDLDQGFVSAAYRYGRLTYALGVTQLGDGEYYAERTVLASAAYHLSRVTLGIKASAMQIDFGGHYDNLSAGSVGMGFSYRGGRILIAAAADNVNWPQLDQNSEKIRPSYTLYTEIIGGGSYSVTGKFTVQDREKPVLGVGQKIGLSSIASVFWGISTEPIIYGGGLELIYKRSLITYATSYHPTLGFSHTLSLSFMIGKTGSAADDQSQTRGH